MSRYIDVEELDDLKSAKRGEVVFNACTIPVAKFGVKGQPNVSLSAGNKWTKGKGDRWWDEDNEYSLADFELANYIPTKDRSQCL